MKHLTPIRGSVMLAAILLVIGLSSCKDSATDTSSDIEGGVYKPSSSPFGTSYADWSAKWWQWAFSTQVHDISGKNETHPLRDSTGANAANGQNASSSVFYLGGVFGPPLGNVTRNVTIASSKAIFLPLVNAELDTTGGWNADSVTKYTNLISAMTVTLTATIDGVAVPNLTSYKATSSLFDMTLPADNLYQYSGYNFATGTVIKGVKSVGYWLMLAPLAKGSHTVHFTANVPDLGLTQDITYKITSN